jgi:hypothetical protein
VLFGDGHWLCGNCDKTNPAETDDCEGCNVPIRVAIHLHFGKTTQTTRTARKAYSPAPGDWSCSKCTNPNFSGRRECYVCKAPKEQAEIKQAASDGTSVAQE